MVHISVAIAAFFEALFWAMTRVAGGIGLIVFGIAFVLLGVMFVARLLIKRGRGHP